MGEFYCVSNTSISLTKKSYEMAPHSSTLAWKIPWTEEPGRLQSMGSLRVGHDWVTSLSLFTFMNWEKEMATHSSILARRIPGTEEPSGLLSVGSHRIGHDWSDSAAAALTYYDFIDKSEVYLLSIFQVLLVKGDFWKWWFCTLRNSKL